MSCRTTSDVRVSRLIRCTRHGETRNPDSSSVGLYHHFPITLCTLPPTHHINAYNNDCCNTIERSNSATARGWCLFGVRQFTYRVRTTARTQSLRLPNLLLWRCSGVCKPKMSFIDNRSPLAELTLTRLFRLDENSLCFFFYT